MVFFNGENALVSGTTDNSGFSVGEAADCAFRGLAYTTAPDTVNARVDFAYDAYGRRVLETVTGGDGSTWWKRQYIWDGWRLLQERNALTGAVIADYYYGPNYVDELLLCRRDVDGNGSYAADGSEDFYYLTDHQYSTLAIVDGTGTIVERYSYSPFGEASYYDGDGAPAGGSAIGNRFLFTGRERHEILPLYDYRNRMYDPGSGRFLSPDPVYDPANLGNVYTYVGNNPLSYQDPFGEERWGEQSYFADMADVGYGYFISGPTSIVTGTVSAVVHLPETVHGVGTLAGSLWDDPLGTAGGLASQFYAQFEDSDTAGQATFGAATVIVPTPTTIAKLPTLSAKAGNLLRGTRILSKASAVADDVADATQLARTLTWERVTANIAKSADARRVSNFDVHIATEQIVSNARSAVVSAKSAGLTNAGGRLGTRAHLIFAELNLKTAARLAQRGIRIEVEPYRIYDDLLDVSHTVGRGTKGSLSVDVLIHKNNLVVRAFDLKTGRIWSRGSLARREQVFGVRIEQLRY